MNLQSLFPHGSNAFFQANTKTNSEVPPAKSQRPVRKTLVSNAQGKNESMGRVTLRYTCRFVRPRDTDNLVGSTKALTDGLRRCGLLQNDDPASLRLIVEQEKVEHYDQEHIEIELIYP